MSKLNIKDDLINHNIYLSCILSFINTTTLSNRDMSVIRRRFKNNQLDETYILSLYNKSARESIILWHLDESYNNLVELLLNKIKIKLSNLLQSSVIENTLSEDTMRDIMWSSFTSTVGGSEEEDIFEN